MFCKSIVGCGYRGGLCRVFFRHIADLGRDRVAAFLTHHAQCRGKALRTRGCCWEWSLRTRIARVVFFRSALSRSLWQANSNCSHRKAFLYWYGMRAIIRHASSVVATWMRHWNTVMPTTLHAWQFCSVLLVVRGMTSRFRASRFLF